MIGGIAAITLGVRKMGEASREAKKDAEDHLAALIALGEGFRTGPTKADAQRVQLGQAEGALVTAEAQRSRMLANVAATNRMDPQFAAPGELRDLLSDRALSRFDKLSLDIVSLRETIASLTQKIDEATRTKTAFTIPGEAPLAPIFFGGPNRSLVVTEEFRRRREEARLATNVTAAAQKNLAFQNEISTFPAPLLGERIRREREFADALRQTNNASLSAAVAVNAIGSSLLGLINLAQSGGNFGQALGGVFGLVGGALAFANPVAGAIVGGIGAGISALSSNNDPVPTRLVSVSNQAAAQMNRRSGPDHVTFIIQDRWGNTIREIEWTLNDRSRRDANPRLPGGAAGPGSVTVAGGRGGGQQDKGPVE